jgi:hypothetical protein
MAAVAPLPAMQPSAQACLLSGASMLQILYVVPSSLIVSPLALLDLRPASTIRRMQRNATDAALNDQHAATTITRRIKTAAFPGVIQQQPHADRDGQPEKARHNHCHILRNITGRMWNVAEVAVSRWRKPCSSPVTFSYCFASRDYLRVSLSPAGVEPASNFHLGETAGVGRRAGSFCSTLSGTFAEEPEGEAPQVKE